MSGGNKCRRKKCNWNICHLGINVVQSTCTSINILTRFNPREHLYGFNYEVHE